MAAKLLESPAEHLKEESRHFLFKELFCLQLKCCCSSLLGGRSLLWLHDSATSDWSPRGTTINTLPWQPDGPQQPLGSPAAAWDGDGGGDADGDGDGMAWPGCSPRDGHCFSPWGNLHAGHEQQVISLVPKHQIIEHSSTGSLQLFCSWAAAKGASLPCAAMWFIGTWGALVAHSHSFPAAPPCSRLWPHADPPPFPTVCNGSSSSQQQNDLLQNLAGRFSADLRCLPWKTPTPWISPWVYYLLCDVLWQSSSPAHFWPPSSW